jgi:hypothetical protein
MTAVKERAFTTEPRKDIHDRTAVKGQSCHRSQEKAAITS